MQTVTFLVIAICIGICAYINTSSDKFYASIKAGALYPPKVKSGEYWRLLASGFVHINLYHLLVNVYALYNMRWLEGYLGSFRYVLVLLAAILGGSLVTYKFGRRNAVTVGISGGIYGLMAIYIVLLLKIPYIQLSDIIQMFLPTILVNFMPNISVTGHLGGFIAGIIMAFIFGII
jgi:rhomboid protease GluP